MSATEDCSVLQRSW